MAVLAPFALLITVFVSSGAGHEPALSWSRAQLAEFLTTEGFSRDEIGWPWRSRGGSPDDQEHTVDRSDHHDVDCSACAHVPSCAACTGAAWRSHPQVVAAVDAVRSPARRRALGVRLERLSAAPPHPFALVERLFRRFDGDGDGNLTHGRSVVVGGGRKEAGLVQADGDTALSARSYGPHATMLHAPQRY